MNEIQVFCSDEFGNIRALVLDDAPWWVGKDVAVALNYKDTAKAIKTHVDDEDRRLVKVGEIPTLKTGNFGATIINESGLYSLILSSKLPSAKRFKRWVTSEVLPALRQTGRYALEGDGEPDTIPQRAATRDDYLRAAAVISNSKAVQLPYVLNLLRQGGFTIPELSPIGSTDRTEAVRLINAAINDHGMTLQQVGDLIGVHRGQIHRYRSGAVLPGETRAQLIIEAIRRAIPDIA